jgi:diaminopimelate epimerase
VLKIAKAHAYGNDFLFVSAGDVPREAAPSLARRLCERHAGVGADGLALFADTADGAAMELFNADGSVAEVSGNGVRCLAALVLRQRERPPGVIRPGTPVVIRTGAGEKTLTYLDREGPRYRFRAAMGAPTDVREVDLDAAGERLRAVVLNVGNPQCVVVRPRVDEAALQRFGPALERHAYFPARTNVEFVEVLDAGRVRILIWERGVGPTRSSGTGSCAAAVAAVVAAGASRDLEVIAPGGSQRVEWQVDGLYLTGWAEPLFEAHWPDWRRPSSRGMSPES